MPVFQTRGALFKARVVVANQVAGFHPYAVTITKSGVYLEYVRPDLLHISLHTRPLRNDQTKAECHIRIPAETVGLIQKLGFKKSRLFTWERSLGQHVRGYAKQACHLTFPSQYAQAKYRLSNTQPGLRDIVVPLGTDAPEIGFWFGASKDRVQEYIKSFGTVLTVVQIKHDEWVGLSSVERTRDYTYYQPVKGHATYSFGPDTTGEAANEGTFAFGPCGQGCYGVVHGKMTPMPTP